MNPADGLSFAMVLLVVGGVIAGGIGALIATRLLARRESGADAREISRALEDMSEGRFDRLPPVEEGEPLAPIAAALASLSEVLRRRGAEHERQAASLRALLDRAEGTAFLATDGTGDILFASEGVRALLGVPPEELRGKPVSRVFADESWEAIAPKLARRGEAGAVRERVRVRRRGGGEAPAHLSVASGPEGKGLFLTLRDGIETEALERDLRDAEEKYRRLAEGLSEGALVLQDGIVVWANPAMEALLATPASPLAGRPFREVVASEDILRIADLIAEAEAGRGSARFDARLNGLSGVPVEAEMSLAPVRLGGRPAAVGSLRDVGRDRNALRQLISSEARLDATLEATSDGILMLSGPPGRRVVTVANRRLGELLGLPAAEAFRLAERELATRLSAAVADRQRFEEFFRQVCASVDLSRGELFDLGAKAGRVLEAWSAPATAPDGAVVGRIFSFRDVTGREDLARAKERLERANGELEAVNRTLQQRSGDLDRINQELRSLDQMRSSLLANVSHELQTPLVSIKGYTEMILKGRLGSITEEQRRGLDISLRNIDRLIGMIENLLSLARRERELPAMELKTFLLWDLIEEAIDTLREPAEKRRVTVTTRYLTEDLAIKADREKILQVFLNLLSNAIKFNRDGGEASLSVRRGRHGYLLVEVRDTGIGIPAESLDRIFDRDFRVDEPAAREREGQGLGLAIVRDILRLHGCTVKADSRLGEGAVFTFTLPLAATPEPVNPAGGGETRDGEPPAPTIGRGPYGRGV